MSHCHRPHGLPTGNGLLSRRQLLAGAAAGALVAGVGGCTATNPATGRSSFTGIYSVEDDIALGREYHPKMLEEFGGEYDHPTLNRYVAGIGNRLAAHAEFKQFTYRFTIVNSPIVNAFATAGGYVYISRGLLALASNEAELAGVLAHEIGHINARHVAERMTAQQVSQIGLLLGAIGLEVAGVPGSGDILRLGQTIANIAIQSYSREQEFESDTLGVRYMSRAGYDPDAMVTFLSSLGEQSRLEAELLGLPPGKVDEFNIMSTHPRTADRVKKAQVAADTQRPADPLIGRDIYLDNLNGLLYGDDPHEQGVIYDRRFVHAGLRFEFTVPPGYILRNSPTAVMAFHSPGNQVRFDIGTSERSRDIGQYLTSEWAAKVNVQAVERITINGMPAATGYFDGNSNAGRVRVRLVAIQGPENKAYRLMYVSTPQHYDAHNEELRRSAYSFRRISEAEAARINAKRLLVVPVHADDTVASLARNLPYGRLNERWFRVLNDMQPGQPLATKQRVKVVAA